MVTRLLIGLLCFSCVIAVVAQAQGSMAQVVAPKGENPPAAGEAPVQEEAKPAPAKKVLTKPKPGVQESKDEKSDVQEPDEPKKVPANPKASETAKSETNAPLKKDTDNLATQSTKELPPKPAATAPETTEKLAAAELEKVPDALPAILSENLLPASTKFWLSIPDASKLEKQFESTQFGLLSKDPAIKPFIDSLRDQVKQVMNDHNVSLGIEVDDVHAVHSGEICVAGVLPDNDGKQLVKGSHGLIVLFDVSNTKKEAQELQVRVNEQLKKRGAKIEEKNINGVAVTKATLKQQKPIRHSQSNFQAIVNDWMLVSDNEKIFRDVLRRLHAPEKIQRAETLASLESFKMIMKQTDLKDHESQIRWFVDPFGYIQLAQALEDEKRGDLQPRDDWSKVLRDQGFGAFKGVGGNIAIATGEHEVLHQTFTFAPRDPAFKNADQVFRMFNFHGNSEPLEPANWVPEDASAFVVGNWEFSDALKTVGSLWDAFLDEEGAFKRTLNDFKVDPQMRLDIEKLISLLNNRVTIASAVERPINETSERVVIGIPIKTEPTPGYVFDSLVRATSAGGQVIQLGGIDVIEVDSALMQSDVEDPEFALPGELDIEEEEPEKPTFQLFAKRYFVVHKGYLLVANNKNYLRKLLAQKKSKLAECSDYLQIKEAIAKLTDEENICWRQFGRMDRTLETNYEMLRRGEMGKSQTVLARVINQIFAKQAADKAEAEGKKLDEDLVRQQKLDGSKLPGDYEKSIAPYFGPMGWVMETDKNGWRITGCVTKKKGMTEVVQKTPDEKDDSQQR